MCCEGQACGIVDTYEGGPDTVWKVAEGFLEEERREGGEGSYLGRRNSMYKGPEAEDPPPPCVQGSENKCDGACKTGSCLHFLLNISPDTRHFSKSLSYPNDPFTVLRS